MAPSSVMNFLDLKDHIDVAEYFGLSYEKLAEILYSMPTQYLYKRFRIPKRSGGEREIAAPMKALKVIQKKLSIELLNIYPGTSCAHGFTKNKSTITNARTHTGSRVVLNIDLADFFPSIHFGRVKNLFMSTPFGFSYAVATILARISCFENRLPQGSPSSPIISNLISWKLDGQLKHLARVNSTLYTRYADDITFSFKCSISCLPKAIVESPNQGIVLGDTLLKIIHSNGFQVNQKKTRISDKSNRMEVTGITINQELNVPRAYIRNIASILYAWEKHGYDNAQTFFSQNYGGVHCASGESISLSHHIRGKLCYLRNVRSDQNQIFRKLAKRFNKLVPKEQMLNLPTFAFDEYEKSLWIIEIAVDREAGPVTKQGTGFEVSNGVLVTCAHAVSEENKIIEEAVCYRNSVPSQKFPLVVEKISYHHDVAICKLPDSQTKRIISGFELSNQAVDIGEDVILVGYPSHGPGHSMYCAPLKVVKMYTSSGVRKFEPNTIIREGLSGGPVLNVNNEVVGMILEGQTGSSGNNGCITVDEIQTILSSIGYEI